MKPTTLPLILALFGGAAACSTKSEASTVLKFTAIPDQNTTELKRKYDPIAKYLGDKLGVKVEYVPVTDYPASVDQFKNGDIMLAWFGGLTHVQARLAVPGARAIAMGAEDKAFKSYLIANKSLGLSKGPEFPAEALMGKRFAFGSRSSTSGCLMPTHFIKQACGKTPTAFFGEANVVYSGSHDKTIDVVRDGTSDVGVLNYEVYESRLGKDPALATDCPVIWETPPYPDYNLTVHPDVEKHFGAGFIDRLQKALVDMPAELARSGFVRSAIIAADNSDFDAVETVARDLGLLSK